MSQCNVCVPKKTRQKVVHKSVTKDRNIVQIMSGGVDVGPIRNGGFTTILALNIVGS